MEAQLLDPDTPHRRGTADSLRRRQRHLLDRLKRVMAEFELVRVKAVAELKEQQAALAAVERKIEKEAERIRASRPAKSDTRTQRWTIHFRMALA